MSRTYGKDVSSCVEGLGRKQEEGGESGRIEEGVSIESKNIKLRLLIRGPPLLSAAETLQQSHSSQTKKGISA